MDTADIGLQIASSEIINWENLYKIHVKNDLCLLTINMRSLKNKFQEFFVHLSGMRVKITFVLITESWLNPDSDVMFELPGYKSFNFYRPRGIGGGLKLYCLEHISVQKIDQPNLNSCELLLVRAFVPGLGNLKICGIYRPPQNSPNDFLHDIDPILSANCDSNFIIAGDFNLDTLDVLKPYVSRYTDLLTSYGLQNHVNLPTYITPNTLSGSSCLDHIWSNLCVGSRCFVINPPLSDHNPVAVIFDTLVACAPKTVKYRDYRVDATDKYLENIDAEFGRFNGRHSDVNIYADNFIKFSTELMEKYFPVKTKILTQKKLKAPWITWEIKKCIDKKHRWHRLAKSGYITMRCYKSFCKTLRLLLKITEQKYNYFRLNSLRNNMQKIWKILNSLLGRKNQDISDRFKFGNSVHTDPKTIAKAFNDHFINLPIDIQNNIRDANEDFSHCINDSRDSFFLEPVHGGEMEAEISKLKKRGKLYDVSSIFLNISKAYVTPILCDLFNKCFEAGIFPNSFKVACITPIFKKGSNMDIKNYRPVAVLPTLSKLFESLMYKRIQCYFENSGFLNPHQYGFRKQRNTELAIFSVINRVISAFEKKSYAVCVFLDFSKCFDTLCRGILTKKSERYGIRGTPLDLVGSYFNNRSQQVEYRGIKSNLLPQDIGVIQGSKLGPLFYDIYTSDLYKICDKDELVMFADDTCIKYTGENLQELNARINSKLQTIIEWCCANKLCLNPAKCTYMLFTTKNVESDPLIKLNDAFLKREKTFKYLGVFLDENLKYQKHIENVCNGMARLCGVTYQFQNHLNLISAKNIYYACIYSKLTYCICVYGGIFQCTQRGKRLINLQERAVKNLFSPFCNKNICIFKQTNLLKLKDIHVLYMGIYMYKILNQNLCPTLQSNLDLIYPNHNHDTRGRENLVLPFPRVETLRINFKYQCNDIWNKIPSEIKSSKSLKSFKRELTSYLINKY